MSAPTRQPATSAHAVPTPGNRVPRRFVRGAVPFAVVLAVFLASGILWWVEQLDPSDPAYLSPVSAEQPGSRALANLLAARGVTIDRVTSTPQALNSAAEGDSTLFITTPGLVWTGYLRDLPALPDTTRIVLVAPGSHTLSLLGLPVTQTGDRWAPGTVAPGCALPEATAAGAATALVNRYATTGQPARHRCYDGGLLSFGSDAGDRVGGRLDVIGAAEPFTNDRLGDAGNAALAIGLLSAHPKLIWLDLHETERRPARPATPDRDRPDPEYNDSNDDDEADDADENAWPLLDILPPWMVAVFAQLLLAAVLCALWQARRLGAPVGEPLPVVVRSAETVEGRARLYQRANARGPALAALRAGALRRLAPALDLPGDAPADTVVAVLAARTGWPADEVHDILYGSDPADDAALKHAAARLDLLVAAAGTATTAPEGAPPRTGKDIPR